MLPNKYPVLRIEGKLSREGVGMFDVMSGVGAHEVIVETPDHNIELADLPESHIAGVVRTYRDRVADLGGDDRFKYVLIFKNQGYLAGASISHPHSQLIATPVTPTRVKEELLGAQLLRLQAALCLLRHHQTGNAIDPRAPGLRERRLRGHLTLRRARALRDLDRPKAHNCDFSRSATRIAATWPRP